MQSDNLRSTDVTAKSPPTIRQFFDAYGQNASVIGRGVRPFGWLLATEEVGETRVVELEWPGGGSPTGRDGRYDAGTRLAHSQPTGAGDGKRRLLLVGS